VQSDDSIAVYDIASQKRVALYPSFALAIHHLTFSPDSRYLLGMGGQHMVRVWDTTQDPTGSSFDAHTGTVHGLSWGAIGSESARTPVLASAGADGRVRLWDGTTKQIFDQPIAEAHEHQGAALTVAIQPGGNLVASGGQDGTVRLWDASERGRLKAV